ncbi:MAG: DNA replication/repair protein RecF [Armatimonadetes bacterium]|nr:DNA replication/repair protein RecF [Armatimonadota bacterium]
MFLERLELTDFRNYVGLKLAFERRLTVFQGANAQGKTNLLEAVALLALARSPRAARDGEMVRWGAAEAVIRGEARRGQRDPVAVSLSLKRDGGKSLRVDGQPRKRLADGIGELVVVYFGPGELQLVSGAPGDRREFLNTCIGQTSSAYLTALGGYRGVLRQRNSLLRSALGRGGPGRRVDENLLLALDDELADRAGVMMALRRDWTARLGHEAADLHRVLSGGREELEVSYEPHLRLDGDTPEQLADGMREQLIVKRTDEMRRGLTLVGPHRDDLRLRVNDVDARTFGSQGQQRTAALALKMAELRVVAQHLGEAPILLLDDVLSELDSHRRAAVIALAEEADQVLLSGAEAEGWDLPGLAEADRRMVEAGTVQCL